MDKLIEHLEFNNAVSQIRHAAFVIGEEFSHNEMNAELDSGANDCNAIESQSRHLDMAGMQQLCALEDVGKTHDDMLIERTDGSGGDNGSGGVGMVVGGDGRGPLGLFQETNNVDDLKNQVFYRFIQRTYVLHVFAQVFLIYTYGGFPYVVWVVGVMTTWSYHVTFLVNSACHVWGTQKWDTGDLSKNNWWVALLTFGEGWHNNHHAFEYSARHGLELWQIDLCWYIIRFLEALGLATNVKLPTEAHKLKKSFSSHNKFK
ncbi:palmitoyl-monogalactosyldiacylglycerol delta-7 desaturase, chloroplastic-like [Lactuca sativa]|uniref:palmitoyl-monogalactosyldiacylglycerol delta-7 desaturase, chloroplastic-like n=1 Tax=Lactuca sativa TaxID=4236 RepID=UPI000CD8D454|nr:palmitoyl-monogalactosyldiacylglycerol delta-7 desaturase, chloroplastic-like [Lactuca sativa]